MEDGDKVVVQCFYPYSMEFRVSDGIITMPSKTVAPKNVIVMSKAHYKELIKFVTFADMIEQRLYRVLQDVPNSYWDSVEQVSRANLKLSEVKAEAEQAKADAEAAKKVAKKLQEQLDDLGGATAEVDKKVLSAQAERDEAIKNHDDAQAEIARLRKELEAKKGK